MLAKAVSGLGICQLAGKLQSVGHMIVPNEPIGQFCRVFEDSDGLIDRLAQIVRSSKSINGSFLPCQIKLPICVKNGVHGMFPAKQENYTGHMESCIAGDGFI
jgi:hypothetical protein